MVVKYGCMHFTVSCCVFASTRITTQVGIIVVLQPRGSYLEKELQKIAKA